MRKINGDHFEQAATLPFNYAPAVIIIVPAFDEEINALKTIENLLRQD